MSKSSDNSNPVELMFDTWATLANWMRKNAAKNKGRTTAAQTRSDRCLMRMTVAPPGSECFISHLFPPGIGRMRQFLRLSPRDWLGGDEGRDAGGGEEGAGCGRDAAGGGE